MHELRDKTFTVRKNECKEIQGKKFSLSPNKNSQFHEKNLTKTLKKRLVSNPA